MATKKAVAIKTAVPAKKTVAKNSVPTKAPAGAKAPAQRMSKIQVIRYMAENTELPVGQCAAFLAGLVELAITQTKKNGEFTIPGLGKLVKAQRAARMGRNPATGESIKIAAKTTVKFRLSKAAKDAVVPPKN